MFIIKGLTYPKLQKCKYEEKLTIIVTPSGHGCAIKSGLCGHCLEIFDPVWIHNYRNDLSNYE